MNDRECQPEADEELKDITREDIDNMIELMHNRELIPLCGLCGESWEGSDCLSKCWYSTDKD